MNVMPIILSVITILIPLIVLFWDWFNANANVIGTITTSLAFFAAIWTALEGRKSAKAAFLAVRAAENSLDDSRKNFKKEAFNQRFSLLLEQHNNYLNKVNEYLRSADGWQFLSKVFNHNIHTESFYMLKGHFALSPYMRILYHLLKSIEDDYYGDKEDFVGMKKYSSLVRSLISNDVLYLIAVNASITYEQGKRTQYERYQNLLHRFDFFEHADFYRINDQIDASKTIECRSSFYDLESDIKMRFSKYCLDGIYNILDDYEPTLPGSTILSYMYSSPKNEMVHKYFADIDLNINNLFVNEVNKKSYQELFKSSFSFKFINAYFIKESLDEHEMPDEITEDMLLSYSMIKSIIRGIKSKRLTKMGNPQFRYVRLSVNNNKVIFHSLFEQLFDAVNEYLIEVNRKNYISFMKENLPVNRVILKINEMEKQLKSQTIESI